MNQRIHALAKQARIYADENEEHWHPCPSWDSLFEEKFAELIVRECIGNCEFVANMATIVNTGEIARKTKATADSCAAMIKQHFGVE